MRAPDSYQAKYAAPFAVLGIRTAGGSLTGIEYLPRGAATLAPLNGLAERVCRQIERYLDDPGFRFDLPFELSQLRLNGLHVLSRALYVGRFLHRTADSTRRCRGPAERARRNRLPPGGVDHRDGIVGHIGYVEAPAVRRKGQAFGGMPHRNARYHVVSGGGKVVGDGSALLRRHHIDDPGRRGKLVLMAVHQRGEWRFHSLMFSYYD